MQTRADSKAPDDFFQRRIAAARQLVARISLFWAAFPDPKPNLNLG
jgi:hypothetical protein